MNLTYLDNYILGIDEEVETIRMLEASNPVLNLKDGERFIHKY